MHRVVAQEVWLRVDEINQTIWLKVNAKVLLIVVMWTSSSTSLELFFSPIEAFLLTLFHSVPTIFIVKHIS